MSTEVEGERGIRILSFDNGGPGTYSQLLIIKEYMARLASDSGLDEGDLYPADYFELMGGVGFGGLCAIFLGHLRMTIEQAIDGLLFISSDVFPPQGLNEKEANIELNSRKLKGAIESILQARNLPLDLEMKDQRHPSTNCKVVIYAAAAANLSHPVCLRTYSSRKYGLNPTIVDAIRATMAIPAFFTPVKIGPPLREQSFVGGALGANNPTQEILREALNVFGKDRRIAQIISLGSGRPRVLSLDKSTNVERLVRMARDMASDCEIVANELSSRFFGVNAYLRLNVDRGMENIRMNHWTTLGDIEAHTSSYVDDLPVTNLLDISLQRLQERIGTVTLGQINHASSIKVLAKAIPALSPFYVVMKRARDALVEHLVNSTSLGQRIFPITGMGGCGKTQLVSYFIREFRTLFIHIVFVDASSVSSLKADFQVWAQSLGDGHEQDSWEEALRFLASGPHNGRWVLVMDNADDPHIDLVPFIPKCYNGTVLITSRNRDVGNLANTFHLELGQMDTDEAISTLLQAAKRQPLLPPSEQRAARKLVQELGCLPVALVHAGTYCRQLSSVTQEATQYYTFTQYLSLFYSERAALMKTTGIVPVLDGYQRGVYTALDLSYKVLPPSSKEFLHVISHFYHSDIPLSIFAIAAKESFNDPHTYLPRSSQHQVVTGDLYSLLCPEGKWSEVQVQDIVQTLRSFSLVSTTVVSSSIFLQLHPLVQAWCRDMPLSNGKDFHALAWQIITSSSPEDNVHLYRYLVSHINDLLLTSKGKTLHVNDQMAAGEVLRKQGRYHDAEILFAEVLRSLRNKTGKETEDTLIVSGWLARTLNDQGQWKAAETLELQVLDQRRRILGIDHPASIRAASNLSSTYWRQGRWDEAAALGLEVLEQCRRVLGLDNLETIAATGSLAAIYGSQGRWKESEKLGLEVLTQLRKILGVDHPNTIRAAANLASTYTNLGRWLEAEILELEVLKQQRRIIGSQHPDTLRASENLASTYKHQGRYVESEKLDQEVFEQRKRILGMDHPDTIRAVANLASSYYELGRWDDAEKMDLKVLEQQRKVRGLEHPDTITAAANLASTYHDQGRFEEAEELNLEVVSQRQKILGPDHPDTSSAMANLASDYLAQGRLEDAEALNLEVVAQKSRTLGEEHPDTMIVVVGLAFTYMTQNRWGDAEALLAPAVEVSIRVRGLRHPDTQVSIREMAMVYEELGKVNEALKMKSYLLPSPDTSTKQRSEFPIHDMKDSTSTTRRTRRPRYSLRTISNALRFIKAASPPLRSPDTLGDTKNQ